jgi:hypothetical protein
MRLFILPNVSYVCYKDVWGLNDGLTYPRGYQDHHPKIGLAMVESSRRANLPRHNAEIFWSI